MKNARRTTKTPVEPEEPAIEFPAAANRAAGAKITINDIARLSGVSKKTVSRVINNSPLLNAETRERIQGIIDQHGYVPDPQARGLAFRRAFLIGLVYDNPNAQYVIDMQQGILDAVRGSGYELIVHPCDRAQPNFLLDLKTFVQRQKLFGVVLPPSVSEDDGACRVLREIDCPFVRIASVPLDEPASSLVTNDYRGAYEAAIHLADLGHKRIAFISGPQTFRSSHERRRGFALGLESRGLTLDPTNSVEGAYTFESGWRAGQILLTRPDRPTAIFAGNDEMATGVYRAAHEAGLAIPGDLSVIGFDDSAIAAKVWPPLSSVRLPIRAMGRMAAEKLLARARPADAPPAPDDEVVPSLVIRQSSGPPAR
jgi:LacI family transcriptional regulator